MKILVLAPRFPYPLDKGDKLRLYHQIVELSKQHDLYLFALSHRRVPHDDYDHLLTYCTAVDCVQIHWWESLWGIFKAFLTGKPLQVGYWSSCRAKKAYAAWERQVQPDVVYCQMVRTMPTISALHQISHLQGGVPVLRQFSPLQGGVPILRQFSPLQGGVPVGGGGSSSHIILDFQDALSLNTRRRMELSHGPLRWILNYEYRALQRTEQEALRRFDATTVISPVDQEVLSPSTVIVPNGVDTEYFNSSESGERSSELSGCGSINSELRTPNSELSELVFTGNMSYAPNVDAARYLVEEVMPLVWRQLPEATVLLAGADPKPAVRALASARVVVSGRMADIREAYASSLVFVAPMRIGSGLQNKLLEAMAMKLPCVTTSVAAVPLGQKAPVLVGDNPQTLADHLVRLLRDESLRRRLAEEGRRYVVQHHSWSSATAPLEGLIKKATGEYNK